MSSAYTTNNVPLSFRLLPWQVGVLMATFAFLIGAAGLSAARDLDAFSLLWVEPSGRSMLMSAAVLLVLHSACLLGTWLVMNNLCRSFAHLTPIFLALGIIANLVSFVLFFIPVVIVLWTAPSALMIQRAMFAN